MKKIILLISFLFLSINGYSQFPEGFEGFPAPTPPTWTLGSGDWAVFDNGVQSTPPTYWSTNPAIFPPHAGTVAAYMDSKNIGAGNTSEDYLASPLITVPANAQLKFWARTTIDGNDNTTYRVMFALPGSTQNNPADYITIAEFDETQLVTGPTGTVNNYDVWTEHIIDLSGFPGMDIYLAFVMVNTQPGASASGDRWLLDDVNIVSQCFNPTTLPTTLITDTTATLNWTGTSPAYDVEVLLATATQGTGTFTNGVTATTLPVSGLLANTCYNYYVRSACSVGNTSGWAGPFNFCTTIAPVGCGGNYADPGGATANYANNITAATGTTLICPPPGELVTVHFTSFATENCCDHLTVYNGSTATGTPIAQYQGTAIPPDITSAAPGECLTFVFTSDTSVTAAGWVADIICAPAPSCSKPITVTTSGTLSTSTNVSWVQPQNPDGSSASEWQVLALPCTSPAPTATSTGWVIATTNANFPLSGLNPDTCYTIYIRAVCSTTLSSDWSTGTNTTTQPIPPACGGTFTDPGGSGANYANSITAANGTTTICPPAGELATIHFTAFATENCCDHLAVYNGSTATGTPIAQYQGTAIPPDITSAAPGECLTFVFTSDTSVTAAGWVADVLCAPAPTCSKPTNLVTSSILSTSLNLSWNQPQNPDGSIATAWQVIKLPCGSPAPTAATLGWIPANTNANFPITGLTPATCYDFYVMAVCSNTDSSVPSVKATATTQVAPPVCGGNYVDLGGATANYPNNVTAANGTTTITPTIPGGAVTVTFTSFATENCCDHLSIFDGCDATAPLIGTYQGNALPPAATSTNGTGCLTFVFTSDNSVTGAGWVANVTCTAPPSCRKPISLLTQIITQTTATLTWTQPQNPDGSTATSWEVIALPLGSPAPGPGAIGIVVNTNSYNLTNLPAGTPYTFYVRAICSATDNSEWSNISFATLPSNDECANAIFAVVNQNLNCVQTTPGTIAGATQSTPAVNCPPGVANDDIWYTFTATADTHIISFPGTANGILNYAIFQGTCGAMTQVGCNSGANLTPGTTYYLRVYSTSATAQLVNFNLCIGTLPCTEAPAFCTGQTVTYANATNVPGIGQVGCLFTTPNPAFFFLQVNNAGDLTYNITQQTNGGTGIDVDYVAWGPFTDLDTACSGVPANPMSGIIPAPNTNAGCPGTLHACSYSAQFNEVLCIPNAQLCEVYVVMITNFSNQAGNVTFTQTNSGGGTTSCFPINTFNYPLTTYCQDGVDPTPILAPGAAAGVYTAVPNTLVIDSATGTVDLSASPPGAYVVTSTSATTVGGTCDTIPFITTSRTIIITAPANATIAYSAPAFCKNINTTELVTITGTSGGSFSTVPATGLYIDSNTGNIVPSGSLPGIYTVNYNIAATGGCAAYTTSTTVTIYDLPTITGNLSVCINNTTQLTGSATPATSNAWASSNTAVATIDNSGLVTAVSAGTTTITYTNDLGCFTTALITVISNRTPTFNAITVCQNGVASFPTASIEGITGTWSSASIDTSASGTSSYTFTPDLTVVGQECAVSGSLSVTVNPILTPTFNTITVCQNGVASLPTASIEGITGTWSSASIDTTALGNFTYTFAPNTTISGQECAVSGTLTVNVTTPITATFTQIADMCEGFGPAPVLSNISNNLISGSWSPSSTIDTSIAGTFTYTFNPDPGQCAVGTTMTVNINAMPTADSPLPVSACDSYILPSLTSGDYYTLPNGQGNNLPVGHIISSTQTLYVYAESGTTPNCTDENSFTVTIVPSPQISPIQGCVGNVYVLEVDGSNIPSNAIYNWTDPAGHLLAEHNSTLEVNDIGNYQCVVIIPGTPCNDLQIFTVDETACSIPRGISPNGDNLNEVFDLRGLNVKYLTIFNRYGTKVYSKAEYTNEWGGKDLNDNDLPDGTYYYVIERNNSETKSGWIYINREKNNN